MVVLMLCCSCSYSSSICYGTQVVVVVVVVVVGHIVVVVLFFNMELNRIVYQYSIVDSILFAILSATIRNSWLVPVPNTSQHTSRRNVKLSGPNSLSRACQDALWGS